ncbi:MAG: subclass B1 metallo-beta-lactamase [Myxococcales bacterium]|nr:subclass B1 metallo-beta-lactamase [Myxococcales bacterium]MCB9628904.1 subclass B1 metallo-beta-lactamase [Sandaracinaceae bacterium]
MRTSILALLFLVGCGARGPARSAVALGEPETLPTTATPAPGEAALGPDFMVRELSSGVLLHVSWTELPEWGRISSNGLVVLGAREALLVDTTWDDGGTERLLDHVESAYGRRVSHAVVTHSHEDRMGGIRALQRRSVTVHGLSLTAERARAAGKPAPDQTFATEANLDVDGVHAEVFFPGAAHAPDNVVVWLPDVGVLFGTCMIRELASTSVGNLADASLDTWVASVSAVRRRVPAPRVVVPGHGEPGDATLLDHTIALVRAAQRQP